MASTRIQVIGGPTALIEYGGLRLLTDPTFDPPGDYPVNAGRGLAKTDGPAVPVEQIGHIDVVLLSHDEHPDNLDKTGRQMLADVPLVLTTVTGAERLGGTAKALPNWQSATVGGVTVIGVPALHGPRGAEAVVGEVIGFVLTGDGLPTVYVSGDNASLDVVEEVAFHTGPIDVAVLFAGGARVPVMNAYLTLTSAHAARAAAILDAKAVVPVHIEGWQHFTQGPGTIRDAFAERGLGDRLVLLEAGESAEF
ncbi:MBL fold metallo-hydrolase [Kibdelosporangium phytohabitans]|uniref:Zn-dependent hydrolase n=1 Tax=Kibdelosporangium phytohabitans TaxID=860235 RepID=A0A0N9HZC1_9PSEU|nr:MBL fold metallo-hydrolase [Kibdelosporangium phytohabitans]ALG08720.1 Zn-dependent hydrolase [Kibdelosporangium phytohabitans]MBE1470166.1 L-ascorbate metabolism protein UlaG (beta-lactamase superfamily) [Kibdelosporangium phytohabitans]